MPRFAPTIILCCALVIALYTFFGDDGISRLSGMERALEQQHRQNDALDQHVRRLRREVNGLQNDPRTLEKAARQELGMARPDEMIFIFEK